MILKIFCILVGGAKGVNMTTPIFQVDAFTNEKFKGNPAAVCILADSADVAWMQAVAREMNLSETAFITPRGDGFGLRWFTPEAEVELCGHATLASAHVLWEAGYVQPTIKIKFNTLSGWLRAGKSGDWIDLDFPSAAAVPGDISEEIIAALGRVPEFILRSGEKWLLEYPDESDVYLMNPDFVALKARSGRGLIITARSEKPGIDFVSRYFAPWIGINEDPVTGSSHTILGPYWGHKLHKTHMTAFQASERGGMLKLRVSGDRTYISGQAVTVFSGQLTT
jgi:PhzF family phenazine biosynthesis protein